MGRGSRCRSPLFIPALALTLGVASHSHLPFQALYTLLWYAAANQVTAANYMGTVLTDGQHADIFPLRTAGFGLAMLAMLAITLCIRSVQHATR